MNGRPAGVAGASIAFGAGLAARRAASGSARRLAGGGPGRGTNTIQIVATASTAVPSRPKPICCMRRLRAAATCGSTTGMTIAARHRGQRSRPALTFAPQDGQMTAAGFTDASLPDFAPRQDPHANLPDAVVEVHGVPECLDDRAA